jgi:hypothetical protein
MIGLPILGLSIFGLPVAGARDDSMPPSGEDRDDELHCESGDDESGTEGGGPPWLPRPRDETNPPGIPKFGSSGAMEGGTYGGVGGDGRGDVRRLTWGGVGGAYRESLAAFLPHDGALDLARNAALAALAASSANEATAADALAPAPSPPCPLPAAAALAPLAAASEVPENVTIAPSVGNATATAWAEAGSKLQIALASADAQLLPLAGDLLPCTQLRCALPWFDALPLLQSHLHT